MSVHSMVRIEKETHGFVRIVLHAQRKLSPQRYGPYAAFKVVLSSRRYDEHTTDRTRVIYRYCYAETIAHSAQTLKKGIQETRVATIFQLRESNRLRWRLSDGWELGQRSTRRWRKDGRFCKSAARLF